MKEIKYSIKKENGEVINSSFKYGVKFDEGVDPVISEGTQDLIAQFLSKQLRKEHGKDGISDCATMLMGQKLAKDIANEINNNKEV